MAISIEAVDGPAFAQQASRILEEAWNPPALHYSPEYLRWQLSFPSRTILPAVAAFDGNEPIGFAGATARRLRCGSFRWDGGIVSFVGVRPAWRHRGVAAALYGGLLKGLRHLDIPVLTFATADSAGDRALRRAYPQAGFRLQALGTYPIYSWMARKETPESDWEAEISEDATQLPDIVEKCTSEETLIWNDPSEAQICHYQQDPRPRKLILLRDRHNRQGAAWIARSPIRSAQSVEMVTTLESVFLRRQDVAALTALLRCASEVWGPSSPCPLVITSPSLYGFDPASLRQAGIRRTGTNFQGYLCGPHLSNALEYAQGTNVEVV